MNQLRQILLIVILALVSVSVKAQNDTESLVQNLQTANFNNLLSYWDAQVEVNLPDLPGQKPYTPKEANELLQSFFNKRNILGFEKNAERKVGNTLYLTGKLLSGTLKYNLTLLLQENKKGFTIVSVRVS
jgi:hypothetical protein